jgi:transcription elongation factor Elf1
MQILTCLACERDTVQVPEGTSLSQKVSCKNCGAVIDLRTLFNALIIRHQRFEEGPAG